MIKKNLMESPSKKKKNLIESVLKLKIKVL